MKLGLITITEGRPMNKSEDTMIVMLTLTVKRKTTLTKVGPSRLWRVRFYD